MKKQKSTVLKMLKAVWKMKNNVHSKTKGMDQGKYFNFIDKNSSSFCNKNNHRRLKNIHPGEILKYEFLLPLKITIHRLARETNIPQTIISNIIKEKNRISSSIALRFSKFFGNTPQFWLGLQNDYDREDELNQDMRQEYDFSKMKSIRNPYAKLLKKQLFRSISYFKAHIAEAISQVNETNEPIYMTKKGVVKAVLLDLKSHINNLNAIDLFKVISLAETDIRNKRYTEQNKFFKKFNAKHFKKIKYTNEEKKLLDSVERGEWKSVPNFEKEKKRYASITKYTRLKNKHAHIRKYKAQ